MNRWHSVLQSTFFALIVFFVPVISWGAEFTIQVGAFESIERAVQTETLVRSCSDHFLEVRVQKEQTGTLGLFHKVLVGRFSCRHQASVEREKLANLGIAGFVRVNSSLDYSNVQVALQSEAPLYFAEGGFAPVSKDDFPILDLATAILRERAISGATTAPETLRAFFDYVQELSDSNPLKSQDIITLAYRVLADKSAYSGENYQLNEIKNLLTKVACGMVVTTPEHKATARRLVAHLLHYYDRDYISALRAYKQILSQESSLAHKAKIQMEIAAATYELAKTTACDHDLLQHEMSKIWVNATQLFNNCDSLDREGEQEITVCTVRIGLMLSEIMIDREQWQEARDVSESIVQA